MAENISFEGGGFKVSEEFISKAVRDIFPGTDHINILIFLLACYLTGFVTMQLFFYFSKKRKMLRSMTFTQKFVFALFFGFGSIMVVFMTYLPFTFFRLDPLAFFSGGKFLPFMILAGFLLYGCLVSSSIRLKGRTFIWGAYRFLEAFFIIITVTFIAISLVFKSRAYLGLGWLWVDYIYIKNRFYPFLKGK